MENYRTIRLLGSGCHARVYKAVDKRTEEPVAIKSFTRRSEGFGRVDRDVCRREAYFLQELHHENIISYHEVIVQKGIGPYFDIFVVMEALDSDLHAYMKRGTDEIHPLSPAIVKRFTHMLLKALHYMHEKQIVHRDLKLENILVKRGRRIVKLADFGLARHFSGPLEKKHYNVVSLAYRAPELLLGTDSYTAAVDMWSLGVVIAEMATGEFLFSGETEWSVLISIYKILGAPEDEEVENLPSLSWNFWTTTLSLTPRGELEDQFPRLHGLGPDGIALLKQLLARDPRKRISAAAALNSSYITSN